MSRDDTIGIFKLKRNGKSIYIVIHDQGIEDYEFIEYMYYKNTKTSLKWTYSFHKAMNIAKLIYKSVFQSFNNTILINLSINL